MAHVVRTGQWGPASKRGVDLVGSDNRSSVTLLLEDMPEGQGPRLHRHPYGEVWVVFAGRGRFTAGGDEFEVTAGDTVYVEAGLPHKFVSLGEGTLRMVCIHEAPDFETEWLEPPPG